MVTRAALVALGPLAIDAYLPAMPEMAVDLATSLHNIEITLSVFLVGFAAGQLFWWGHSLIALVARLTILLGLSVFILGSAAIALGLQILSFSGLAVCCKAFGGGMGVVNTMGCGAATVTPASASAQILSQIVTIMMAAPLLAPIYWRCLAVSQRLAQYLLVSCCLCGDSLVLLRRFLPETRRIEESVHTAFGLATIQVCSIE